MGDKYQIMSDPISDKDYMKGYYLRNVKGATEDDFENWYMHNFSQSKQEHVGNESEDRLFSKEPTIGNAAEYILHVDVLLEGFDEKDYLKDYAIEFIRTDLRNKVRIFDNVNDFNSIKGNTINEKVREIWFSDFIHAEVPNNRADIGAEIYNLIYILRFISIGNWENKDIAKNIAAYLKRYGLEDFKPYMSKLIHQTERFFTRRRYTEMILSCRA